MVSLKVRHLHQVKGRWYWIPSKTAHALGFRSSPLGKDLHEARQAAERLNNQLDAERARMVAQPEKVEQGTVKDLIARYKKSDSYTELKSETRKGYAYRLALIESKAGTLKAQNITRPDLVQTYVKLKERYNPAMAASMMRVWAVLMKHAYDLGWTPVNHAKKLNIRSAKSRVIVWTPEEVNELVAVAISNNRPAVALAARLAYDSGQRPTDVLRLTWSQWEGSGFMVKQSKTEEWVFAPVSPKLAAELNGMVKEGICIVLTDTKRPYSRPHFSREFAEIRDLAQLSPSLQFRDLRRTAATELGKSGATAKEIQAVTGHKNVAMLDVYALPDSTMSKAAAAKRFKNKNSTEV